MGGAVKPAAAMALTQEQVEAFHRDGYLLVEDFLSHSECDALLKRTYDIVAEADFDQHPTVTFSTRRDEESQHVKTDYFINSGDKIRFFFEEGALDSEGKLNGPVEKSLNKIGHALHVLEPEFARVALGERMEELAKSLELQKPAVVQSMVIFKQPHFGGEVNIHQDSTFLHTTPMRLYGVWIALEDADLENGCLWFAPGTHTAGINRRMLRTVKDGRIELKFEGRGFQGRPGEICTCPGQKRRDGAHTRRSCSQECREQV